MRIEISIDIAARPDDVWPVIRDVTHWSEWTESITSVEILDDGPFAVGTRAKVKQPGFPAVVWTVTELTDGASFTWEAKNAGLRSTGTHSVAVGPRGAIATLGIRQEGVLAWPMKLLFGRKSERFVTFEPTARNSFSCNTRSSLACRSRGSSPISSKNAVPPLAASMRPILAAMAPVKDPLTCPNNSLSMSGPTKDEQSMVTKGPTGFAE